MAAIPPDLRALLAACREQYADDGPRRVLADWLEEQGDAVVGQAIRLQLSDEAVAGLPLYRSWVHDLTRHGREAWEAAAGGLSWLDRGLWHVTPKADPPEDVFGPEGEWIGTLAVSSNFDAWLQSPLAGTVPCLRLGNLERDSSALGRLWEWPALRALDIHHAHLSGEAMHSLARQELSLQALALTSGPFGPDDRSAFAWGPAFAGLKRLTLRQCDLAGRDRGALRRPAWASSLVSLEVACCRVIDIQGLVVSPVLETLLLRALTVPQRGLLAGLPSPGRLRRLCLSDVAFDDEAVKHLAAVPLTGLRLLDLSRNMRLTAACLPALGGSTWFSGLEVLSLQDVMLGPAGGAALAALPAAPLRVLDLEGCGLGPAGAEALAGWGALAGVEVLELEGNRIGPAGMRALAARHLPRLRRLDLSDNALGDEGVEALLASPLADELEWLSLRKNQMGERAALALARTPRLARLRQLMLDLGGGKVPAAARAAVRDRYGA